jgi:hypothetical protein
MEVSTKLNAAIEAARVANAACTTAADCKTTSADTPCAGACPVAISTAGESQFQAALSKLGTDYCSDYVSECGYATPSCVLPTLTCPAGICEATFP